MKNMLNNSDSTDLLLDAMCNVFGVVLLLALVFGGISIANKISSPDKVSRETVEKAQSENTLLVRQLQTARAQKELLQKLSGKTEADRGDLAVDKTLEREHRLLLNKVNSLADQIEELDRQLFYEKNYGERLGNSSVAQEKDLIAQYNNSLKQNEESGVVLYGSARTKNMQPWRLLVDAEKFYIIGSNRDIYLNNRIGSAVKINSFKQGPHRFFRIEKLPEKGCGLQEFSLEKLALPSGDRAGYFVELLVEPDAVAAAADIIAELRRESILFAWRIISGKSAVLRTAERGDYEVSR